MALTDAEFDEWMRRADDDMADAEQNREMRQSMNADGEL